MAISCNKKCKPLLADWGRRDTPLLYEKSCKSVTVTPPFARFFIFYLNDIVRESVLGELSL